MRAFVVGNAALDTTLEVPALPAPGVSILGREISRSVGGKGLNQAVAIARCGLKCTLLAPVGHDLAGWQIAERLRTEPLDSRLEVLEGVPTDASTILQVPGGENAVITTNAAATALTPAAAIALLDSAEPGDLLVMQGNLGAETTGALLRCARAQALTVAVNPSPLRPYFTRLLPLVETVFVNRSEAAALGGAEGLVAAGSTRVVLTLGPNGARLIDARGTTEVPSTPAAAVDTTGAGDCFLGVALASAALRGGAPDARALRHAARAAARTVSRPGTVEAFPSAAEMQDILRAP